jgi:UDP-N-acetylglucosamine diphosphorylase/glucosamine-1-phosphate N-acetyltransferase
MRVCLFEDEANNLDPLSLTRPIFNLVCGRTCLGWKQLRYWSPKEYGLLVRPQLAALARLADSDLPVNDPDWLEAGPTLLVNGRWLPPENSPKLPAGPCLGMAGGEVAFAFVEAQHMRGLTYVAMPELLDTWQRQLLMVEAGGTMIRFPWDLVEQNGVQLCRDYKAMRARSRPAPPAHLSLVGPADQLWVHPEARVEPYVVADTTGGPVIIDAQAAIMAFTRLEGPCCVGSASQVHGAKIRGGTTLGPKCRVGGEIEASILHGHSNKYHEGFLGHSYVGEWVNLGAGTHNSDLRNDYGEVTVTIHGEPVSTGQTKAGCYLGDHTKTGLGTLINTGTSVGAFCQLLPAGRFAPKYMPSFTNWGHGRLGENQDVEQLLSTARVVMQRRGESLTDSHIALYQWLRQETAAERQRAIRSSEQRALRLSA